jgi:VanZ family protein
MICILAGTSWPHPPSMPGQSDKVIHFTAYAALGAAMGWAARARSFRRALPWIAVVSMLGAADEWHQQFIPSRSMDVRDWMADTAGAAAGLSLVTALARRRESVA